MILGAATAVLVAAALNLAGGERLTEGNPKSMVRVVIYEDLQCSDCAHFRTMLDQRLLPKYRATVAFEHRDFPLAKHSWASKAAIAARFFESVRAELGVEFRRFAMAGLREITADNFNQKLAGFASSRGVDPHKAVAALDDARLAAQVQADLDEGVARGVARTPTVLVNGAPFVETFTFEEIAKAIDAELAAPR